MKYKIIQYKYSDLIQDIRSYFNEAKRSIWDRRNKIKIVHYDDTEIAIKSFKIPHLINKIAYTFLRSSKAERSYENSLRIIDFVPTPIGYVEFKKFALIYDSYFLSEHYQYDFTIREILTQNSFPDKENIFKQFALFTYALHEANVEHLDYSPGNILIKKISQEQYEFKVIDINRMKFSTLSKEERLENFSKLWANENDLRMIIEAYAKISDMDKDEAIEIALLASKKHKENINLKKKLKGKKVVN